MRADLERAIKLVDLLHDRKRVRVSKIAEELEVSERAAYRWVQSASRVMSIRLSCGIVMFDEISPHGGRVRLPE